MKKILVLTLISLFVLGMSTVVSAKIGYGPVVLDDATVVEAGAGEVAGGLGYATTKNDIEVNLLTLEARVAYGVIDKLEVGGTIPYLSYSEDYDESGLGDMTVGVKYAILTEDAATCGLSAGLDLLLPTGDEDIVGPDNDMDIVISVAASKATGPVDLHGNLGLTIWGEDDAADDTNISYGAAVEYPLETPEGLSVIGEIEGSNLEDAEGETSLNLYAGVKYVVSDVLDIEGTIGTSLADSDYQPDFILGAGVIYAF